MLTGVVDNLEWLWGIAAQQPQITVLPDVTNLTIPTRGGLGNAVCQGEQAEGDQRDEEVWIQSQFHRFRSPSLRRRYD